MAFDLASVLRDVPKSDTGRDQITYLPLADLEADPNNFYSVSNVDNLADAIATVGLQQPLRVRRHPDNNGKYMIVSGHRRRAAITKLVEEGRKDLDPVPCIIEQVGGSAALDELRLIYGNSATRDLTAPEISRQAVRVQELLYKLKEEGYEFPGRMRDHVAEACNISRSKLARLKVIREQLLPALLPLWEQGELNEDVAYKLAQCPQDLQHTLAEVRGNDFRGMYGWWTEKLRKAVETLDEIKTCPATDDGTDCTNRERMVRRMCKAQPYTDLCSSKCCLKCSNMDTCKATCTRCAYLKAKHKAEAKAEAKAKAAEDQAALAAREQPVKDYHDAMMQRVTDLMRYKGVSEEDLDQAADAPGQYYRSKTNIDYLPVGNWMRTKDVMGLVQAADLLGVTLDYLLTGKAPADRWHTEPPTKPCEILAYVSIAGAGKMRCTLRWDGEQWLNTSQPIDKSVKVTAWITPPGGDDVDADC